MSQQLTLDTLGNLDGGQAREIIDSAIKAASEDVRNRGADGKPRKVVITIATQIDKDGDVFTRVEAKVMAPIHKTSEVPVKVTPAGSLLFDGFDSTDEDAA